MKILITGGAGYIGSVLTPRLLDQGHEVTVLDTFSSAQNSLAACCSAPNFQAVRGDCRRNDVLKPLLGKADAVIPLAALVGAPLCDQDELGATSINRDAIKLLVDKLSPEQWLLYPTTNSGYGIGQDSHCTEDSPLNPISLYGRTKVEAEEAVLSRENTLTFRLATVFGASPRMRIDLLVNDFVYRAITDRAIIIFEGHFRRNFIHIQDVSHAFEFALNSFAEMKGQPYNVGLEDANLTKLQLCEVIKQYVHSFTYLEAPAGEDPDKRD